LHHGWSGKVHVPAIFRYGHGVSRFWTQIFSQAPQPIPTPEEALLRRRIEPCERIDLRDL
jgi:hypothetical protein